MSAVLIIGILYIWMIAGGVGVLGNSLGRRNLLLVPGRRSPWLRVPRLGRFLAVSGYLLGRDGVIYKIG